MWFRFNKTNKVLLNCSPKMSCRLDLTHGLQFAKSYSLGAVAIHSTSLLLTQRMISDQSNLLQISKLETTENKGIYLNVT